MIKYFSIIIFVFGSITLFSQVDQKQNPNVELPDFVITGKDIISVESAHKMAPDFVSTLSEEYLKPAFSPEELPVRELGSPLKRPLELNDSLKYVNGYFYFGSGLYSLPVAGFNYTKPFTNGIFEGFADGIYQRAYVENSDRYSLSGGANLSYFIPNDAGFIPGTKFKVHGKYGTSAYKLFASNTPQFKRTLDKGNIYLNMNNLSGKTFTFAAKLADNSYSITEEAFSENLFDVYGMAKISLPSFNLGADVNYKSQKLNNNLGSNLIYNFIKVHPKVGINVGDNLKAEFGFLYANTGANNFISPTASLAFKIDNGVSLFGEYAPDVNFYNIGYFLNKNRYFNIQNFTNLFVSKPTKFNIIIKYEYYTYFEIDAGFKISSSKHYPYFSGSGTSGLFNVVTTDGRSGDVFFNLLFHLGPYGTFYGTAEFNNTQDTSGNILPYYSRGRISMNYGYSFNNGLTTEANLIYHSGTYANINNTVSINPFVDLGLNFKYRLNSNFDLTLQLSNLLNHKNYIWMGYQELPMNVVAGFRYHW